MFIASICSGLRNKEGFCTIGHRTVAVVKIRRSVLNDSIDTHKRAVTVLTNC